MSVLHKKAGPSRETQSWSVLHLEESKTDKIRAVNQISEKSLEYRAVGVEEWLV